MKRINLASITFTFLLLYSCRQAPKVDVKIISKGIKEFRTAQDIIGGDLMNIYYYEFEGMPPLVSGYSDIDNKLYLYNFNDGKVFKTIDIKRTGVQEIRAYQFKDLNTIVFSKQMTTEFFVIDSNANILNAFDFKQFDPNVNAISYACNNAGVHGGALQFVGENLVLENAVFFLDTTLLKHNSLFFISNFDGSNPLMKGRYNIKKSVNPFYFNNTPIPIRKGRTSVYNFVKGDTIYFSSFESDDLDLFDKDGNFIKSIATQKSAKVEDTPIDNSKIYDQDYLVGYMLDKSGNLRFFYDKYRNLYYKVVEHPLRNFKFTKHNFAWEDAKEFSLMIFDSNFKLLNEINFPAKKYKNVSNWIITPEGIYISTANENNPNVCSYKLQWELFEVNLDTLK